MGPEAVQVDVAQMLSGTGAWRKGTLLFTGVPSERSLARVEMHKLVSTTETVDVQQKVRKISASRSRDTSATSASGRGRLPLLRRECGREASGAR